MALTADILATSYGAAVRTVYVTLTVTNGGSSALSVVQVIPGCTIGANTRAVSVAMGQPVVGGNGVSTSVPAGGTLAFVWRITFHAPTIGSSNGAEPGSIDYTPTATIVVSDGSVVTATSTSGVVTVTDTTLTIQGT